MKFKLQLGLIIGTALAAATLLGFTYHKSNSLIENQVFKPSIPATASVTKVLTVETFNVKNLVLDDKQVIVFNTEVDESSVNMAIAKINELSDNGKEIYIVLDSPGGSIFDGVRLISYIEGSKVKVNTVNVGLCASMCAQIFSHGAKRYMLDHSTLMYHLAAGGVQGTVQNMKSLLGYLDWTVSKLDAYIANRAGIDQKEFAGMVAKDLWIDAEDALKLHLGDGLVTIKVKDSGNSTNIADEFKRLNIKINKTLINPLNAIN